MVWALISAGIVLFSGVELLVLSAVNLLLVLLVVYFFQGMAIVSYFFNKRHLPGGLKGLAYIFIFLMWYLGALVVALGLFDLWFDFRKLNRPEEA